MTPADAQNQSVIEGFCPPRLLAVIRGLLADRRAHSRDGLLSDLTAR
ncbi:hypothetical protein ACIOHS_19310 [Streptomyces sp. NPDC088253]